MVSFTATDRIRFQTFFSEHGVDSEDVYYLVEGISKGYESWQDQKRDRYIKKDTDGKMPYSVEYVHATDQVLVHLGRDAPLGEGRSSRVSKTIEFFSGQVFAHKKRKKTGASLITLDREYTLYQQFKDCPNVVQAVQRTHRGILFEYMNCGDLSKYRSSCPEEQLAISNQIALAVSQIHSKNFVHRDVRAANFLCNKQENKGVVVKICDLESIVLEHASGVNIQGFFRSCSPRLVEIQMMHYFKKIKMYKPLKADDLHALAVTLYELETGKSPPFCDTICTIMYAVDTSTVRDRNELDSLLKKLKEEQSALVIAEVQTSRITQLAIDIFKDDITSAEEVCDKLSAMIV